MAVSSAKSLIKEYWQSLPMSFMKIKNNKGPRIEPWGTPQEIFRLLEILPLASVHCFLRLRYEVSYSRFPFVIPSSSHFLSSIAWLTRVECFTKIYKHSQCTFRVVDSKKNIISKVRHGVYCRVPFSETTLVFV